MEEEKKKKAYIHSLQQAFIDFLSCSINYVICEGKKMLIPNYTYVLKLKFYWNKYHKWKGNMKVKEGDVIYTRMKSHQAQQEGILCLVL